VEAGKPGRVLLDGRKLKPAGFDHFAGPVDLHAEI